MNWSIVGLALAGFVAAVCSVILMETLHVDARASRGTDPHQPPSPVEILVAARAMPAMTVVDAAAVVVKSVPADQAPQQYLRSPVRVVGRVLARPMVEGQIFTPECFAREGSAAELAAALPEGKRAVSVSLADYSRLDGLLYPGSVVDVLASFRIPKHNEPRGEPVSTTLLQGVEVLAVEDHTIVSPMHEAESSSRTPRVDRQRMVTLMVTPRQAEALQLAAEHGAITLAMRNPLDAQPVHKEGTRLAELSRELEHLHDALAGTSSPAMAAIDPAQEASAAATTVAGPPRRRWETTVLRAGAIETKSFVLATPQTPPEEGK